MNEDKRLIEDYLPINEIRKEPVRKGHISTLHLWWARRPLTACRAAIYGALIPAAQFGATDSVKETKKSRARAKKFVTDLCKHPATSTVIAEAQRHILKAQAERLTCEIKDSQSDNGRAPSWVEEFTFKGDEVTASDIEAGRAPRARVLDMFSGGGAIPLEALRLGCEAYALDLNPVAHMIELCTLVYPQRYGKPDPDVPGMTGTKNTNGEATWGGLAEEVSYWGNWVLERVRREIGDLYPPIPDPKAKNRSFVEDSQQQLLDTQSQQKLRIPEGYLTPVAYLWTRTVTCKNPNCRAAIPLVRQTWLSRKTDRVVALRIIALRGEKRVRFRVVEEHSEDQLDFDPAGFSSGGNATCPFCGTVADSDYVMRSGLAKRFDEQLMAVVCHNPDDGEFSFIVEEEIDLPPIESDKVFEELEKVAKEIQFGLPTEKIDPIRPSPNARGLTAVTRYGLNKFSDLFTTRQLTFLTTIAKAVVEASKSMADRYRDVEMREAICTYLGLFVSRNAQVNTTMSRWRGDTAGRVEPAFGRHALSMVWDFPEINPFGGLSNDAWRTFLPIIEVIKGLTDLSFGNVARGTATDLPFSPGSFDAVVTDPPYYDNVPYADISDFFYVWLRRSIGSIHSAHFATPLTPKKAEATALSSRHGGDMDKAARAYEETMLLSLREAYRVLKQSGELVLIYAHKTTLGWATLVDALRIAGFVVVEAWPIDTEMSSRLLAMESAALSTSIFLVARRREGETTGKYEERVKGELEQIVRERVETLWAMGISGADLVIASVGAGLRAFTRFARVEYANGEEVPAERFLTEVETVVLESILDRLSKEVGAQSSIQDRQYSLAGLDAPTRFYILWRYTYKVAELDAGEAIIFANGTHIELDGQGGLSTGARSLVEKKKNKYRLRDYAERGAREELGLREEGNLNDGAPLIDTLQRILWLMENEPRNLNGYLEQALPDRERLRQLAQALAGPALKGGDADAKLINTTSTEASALGKLLANWRTLIDARLEEFRLR